MREDVIVDTNVAIVANGDHDDAGDACIARCVSELRRVQSECRLLLDDAWLMLREYLQNLNSQSPRGPGDAFLKWVLANQRMGIRVESVQITPDITREFAEFPDDPGLETFDRSDRKFVAVALASGAAPQILNASDRDWWEHVEKLEKHGLDIRFICPELMGSV